MLKIALSILAWLTCNLCMAQSDSINQSYTSHISYKMSYNSSLIYPGMSMGVYFPFQHANVVVSESGKTARGFAKDRFISGNLNWYHHPGFHDNLYLTVEWVMRRTNQKGFISEFSAGPGYSRTFLSGTTYIVNDNGDISVIKLAGFNYAVITVGGGFGYDFTIKKTLPLAAVFKMNVITMYPYNSTIYVRPVFEIGILFTPGRIKKGI